MKPLKIFVEGREGQSTDAPFIRDCVKAWFGHELQIKENFLHIGGASEYLDMAPDIRRALEKNEVLLIIDANGDYEKSKKKIEEFQARENISFKFFLFPNNRDKGEIETLLEQIATDRDKLNCFQAYEKCIGKQLDIKDKIYAYISAVAGSKAAKDGNRNFLTPHFDLNHQSLQPLNDFLRTVVPA